MRSIHVGVLVAALLGCSHSSGHPGGTSGSDASNPVADAGVDVSAEASADAPSCFTNPQTYLEIINACTDAQAVDKKDDLSPMSLADGGLQPLP